MNEFTIGFEVDFGGISERFVSEEAFKTQQKLKDDYMQRDMKNSVTISELRKDLEEKQDYISELNTRIANQSKEITHLLKNQEKLKAEITNKEQIISSLDANCSMLRKKIEELYDGIRNSDDLTWKEKYDELIMRMKGNNEQNDETCKKLWTDINHISERCRKAEIMLSNIDDIIKENGYRKE